MNHKKATCIALPPDVFSCLARRHWCRTTRSCRMLKLGKICPNQIF